MNKTIYISIASALLAVGGFIALPVLQGTEPGQEGLITVGSLIALAVTQIITALKGKP